MVFKLSCKPIYNSIKSRFDNLWTGPKSHSGAPKTIPEFCEYYKFGKSTFYGLAKRKLAPKTMRIGRPVRISAAAEQEWVARMEAGEAAHVPEFASKPPGCGDKSSDT